jgi:transcriptional regulator with XRE-family HTH domain
MRSDYQNRADQELPRAIRAIRLREGLTAKALGKLLGIGQPQLSTYESGHNSPSLPVLLKLLGLASVAEWPILESALAKHGLTAADIEAAVAAKNSPAHKSVANREGHWNV